MRCRHCGSSALRRGRRRVRQLHGVWEAARSMRGLWASTARGPLSDRGAVVRSAVQARRPGQASIPAAGARGESRY